MRGPFGGELTLEETRAREAVATPVAAALTFDPGVDDALAAGLVAFRGEGGEIAYAGDLRGLSPIVPGAPGALAALGPVLEALEALHARGRAHGDLRPAHVWTGDRVRVTYPARPVDALALLRARLAAGAEPLDLGYVAPEVLAGETASPATDVYSMAALAYSLVTGRPPLGQVELEQMPAELRGIRRALGSTPTNRMTIVELRAALANAPVVAASPTPLTAPPPAVEPVDLEVVEPEPEDSPPVEPAVPAPAPAPTPARVPALASAPRIRLIEPPRPLERTVAQERGDTPVILSCLLLVGAIFTFAGALWLGISGWDRFPPVAQLGILLTLTGGIAAAGHFAGTRGYPRTGIALLALGTQLVWADGGYLLHMKGMTAVPGAWCFVAFVVTALTGWLARLRHSPALVVLYGVCSCVAITAFGAATGEGGWLAISTVIAASAFLGGDLLERHAWPNLGRALLGAGTAPLWFALLIARDLLGDNTAGGVCATVTIVALTTAALASWRRSLWLAILAGFYALVSLSTFVAATGPPVHFGLAIAIALGVAGGGAALERNGRATEGLVLYGIATQLLWIVGLLGLRMEHLEEQPAPWFAVALGVTAVTSILAWRRRSPGVLLLAVLAGVVAAATFGTAYGDPAWLACLLALTVLGAVGGAVLERNKQPESGLALLGLASILVWADGGWILRMEHLTERAGPWAWVLGAGTLSTFGLALARRSGVMSFVGSVGATLAMTALGGALKTGAPEGGPVWLLLTAGLLSLLAAIGQRVAGETVGVPPAAVAGVVALGSALFGIERFLERAPKPATFFAAWPYVVSGAALAVGLVARRLRAYRSGGVALAVAGLAVAGTPTLEAFVKLGEPGYLYVATLVGGALIVLAFQWPVSGTNGEEPTEAERAREAGSPLRLAAILVGLIHVTLAPTVAALGKLGSRDGDLLLQEAIHLSPPELLGHPLFYLSYVVGTSVVLVGLGFLFARGAPRKTPYRILEIAGSLLFFFVLTGLSLAQTDAYLYPLIVFVGGLVALGAAVFERHVVLVFIAGGFLAVNAWIQYFSKLHHQPLGLLMIGFGLGVLGSAFLFERRIKPFLPEMKKWA